MGAAVALEDLPTVARASESADTAASSSSYTRGIGIYPGDPREDFSPDLVPADPSAYRNVALLRPAYHSSSYDFNLTAQLITDGVKHSNLPRWVVTSEASRGVLPKHERELLFDHNLVSGIETSGPQPWVEIQFCGGDGPPEIDKLTVLAAARGSVDPSTLTFTVSASNDGRTWQTLGTATNIAPAAITSFPKGFAHPGQLFAPVIPFAQASRNSHYRVQITGSNAPWLITEVAFFKGNTAIEPGGPYHFTSAWMSAGSAEEWVYVDLGVPCEFDRVVLSWIARAAEGSLQISEDATNWHDLQSLSDTDDIKLSQPARARYVRVFMRRPTSPYGYILSEIEIYGRGGLVPKPKPGLFNWRVQRDSLVAEDAATLSQPGYLDTDWIPATVPGTVLATYLNIGAIPDPDFGDNQLQISDSFFYADFWYRTEFSHAALKTGRSSGSTLTASTGKRKSFSTAKNSGASMAASSAPAMTSPSSYLTTGNTPSPSASSRTPRPAARKQKTYRSPGMNGGALGHDNPTYHASIGWDWIPTIRGRNTGIWDDVSLSTTGAVTVENPFVRLPLPVRQIRWPPCQIQSIYQSRGPTPCSGNLHGTFGRLTFEDLYVMPASTRQAVKFNTLDAR